MTTAMATTATSDTMSVVAVEDNDDDVDEPPATSGVAALMHFLPLPSSVSGFEPVLSSWWLRLRSRWLSAQSATSHSLAGSVAKNGGQWVQIPASLPLR